MNLLSIQPTSEYYYVTDDKWYLVRVVSYQGQVVLLDPLGLLFLHSIRCLAFSSYHLSYLSILEKELFTLILILSQSDKHIFDRMKLIMIVTRKSIFAVLRNKKPCDLSRDYSGAVSCTFCIRRNICIAHHKAFKIHLATIDDVQNRRRNIAEVRNAKWMVVFGYRDLDLRDLTKAEKSRANRLVLVYRKSNNRFWITLSKHIKTITYLSYKIMRFNVRHEHRKLCGELPRLNTLSDLNPCTIQPEVVFL